MATAKKIKQTETLISLIVDESGSMSPNQEQVISGINEYVKGIPEDTKNNKHLLTLTVFNHDSKTVFENKPKSEWVDLTKETYNPNGSTALNDTIGTTIESHEEYIRNSKKDVAVLMVIMTDGAENASRILLEEDKTTASNPPEKNLGMLTRGRLKFSTENLKAIITDKEKNSAWTFVFLGANQDSFTTATGYGVSSGNAINFSGSNSKQMMASLNSITRNYSDTVGVQGISGVSGFAAKEYLSGSADLLNEEDSKLYSNQIKPKK